MKSLRSNSRLCFLVAYGLGISVQSTEPIQAQGIDWTGESLRFADPTQNFAPLRADDVMPRFKAIKPRDFNPLYQPAGPIAFGQWGFGLQPDEAGGGFCVNRGNEMLYVPPDDGQKVFYQRIREWERRTQLDSHVEIWRFDDFRQVTRYDIRYPDGSRLIGQNPYPGNFQAARWEQVVPAGL